MPSPIIKSLQNSFSVLEIFCRFELIPQRKFYMDVHSSLLHNMLVSFTHRKNFAKVPANIFLVLNTCSCRLLNLTSFHHKILLISPQFNEVRPFYPVLELIW